ncbi:hypothetical protein D9757_005882 [Collybiopsis confluens]|uniref:Uncharacterized protein n=1 Tax=Collybiopsis confluens TaxID=2823264 RepID=A0A8H5HND2_9AGAR|nr:hypothetical protein D9757_005882 [Collybiopsis confluens]
MRFFQLGGWRLDRHPRWDDRLSRDKGRKWTDHKVTAEKVFTALTNIPKSNSQLVPGSDAEEVTITLGILESGASVLLLTWDQIRKICSHFRLQPPSPREEIDSSTYQSLSPIEFVDAEMLAEKLRSLAPKPGKAADRDTSQANKAYYSWDSSVLGHKPDGFNRALFENVRIIREIVTGRIPPPSSPSLFPRPAYAQYALRRDINRVFLSRFHLVAFAYTLWFLDTDRRLEDRERSPEILQVGLAKSRNGFIDLKALNEGEGVGLQVDFGWNAGKGQGQSKMKIYPRTNSEHKLKSQLVGEWLFDRLLKLALHPDDGSPLKNVLDGNTEHVFVLVRDERKFRAMFLDLGVDLLKGSSELRRWKYSYDTDVQVELRDLLRDDRYSDRDKFTHDSGSSRGMNGHSGTDYRDRGRDERYYRDPLPNDFQSNVGKKRPYPPSSPSSSSYRSYAATDPRRPADTVKREPELKRQRIDDHYGDQHMQVTKRVRRTKKEDDDDVYDTTEDEDEDEGVGRGEGGASSRGKVKTEERLENGNDAGGASSTSQTVKTYIHIHVLDLKTLFTVANGSNIGAESVQNMARELQKGHGGVQLHGQLSEMEYSAGWDAELMLSIFQKLVDGGAVDDQKASAPRRWEANLEEEEERRHREQEERKRQEQERQLRAQQPLELDEDRDPNDFSIRSARTSGAQIYGGLSQEWDDYGESDDE